LQASPLWGVVVPAVARGSAMALDFFAGCMGGKKHIKNKQNNSQTFFSVPAFFSENVPISVTGCAGVIVGHPFDTIKVSFYSCSLPPSGFTVHRG